MADVVPIVLFGLCALAAVMAMFTGLIYIGFRLGRHTVGKPLPPITKQKAHALVEEDPYWEPMNGVPKPGTPTVEE